MTDVKDALAKVIEYTAALAEYLEETRVDITGSSMGKYVGVFHAYLERRLFRAFDNLVAAERVGHAVFSVVVVDGIALDAVVIAFLFIVASLVARSYFDFTFLLVRRRKWIVSSVQAALFVTPRATDLPTLSSWPSSSNYFFSCS